MLIKERKIADYAGKILKKKYKNYVKQPEHKVFEPCTFLEWCMIEARYDYKFYNWLFADNTIEDYGKNLTPEELLLAKNFFECLENNGVLT